jgi:hypothetical protein
VSDRESGVKWNAAEMPESGCLRTVTSRQSDDFAPKQATRKVGSLTANSETLTLDVNNVMRYYLLHDD